MMASAYRERASEFRTEAPNLANVDYAHALTDKEMLLSYRVEQKCLGRFLFVVYYCESIILIKHVRQTGENLI